MDRLKVPLTAISESGMPIACACSEAEVQPPSVPSMGVRSIALEGVLSRAGAEYLFRGSLAGAFTLPCDRCLQPTEFPFQLEVLWTFAHVVARGDEDAEESEVDLDVPSVVPIHGHEIDLGPQVWEELVLAVPAKVLCREECVGLCTHCGANLNLAPCTCTPDGIADGPGGTSNLENKGLAGLADLFPDLRPRQMEE